MLFGTHSWAAFNGNLSWIYGIYLRTTCNQVNNVKKKFTVINCHFRDLSKEHFIKYDIDRNDVSTVGGVFKLIPLGNLLFSLYLLVQSHPILVVKWNLKDQVMILSLLLFSPLNTKYNWVSLYFDSAAHGSPLLFNTNSKLITMNKSNQSIWGQQNTDSLK